MGSSSPGFEPSVAYGHKVEHRTIRRDVPLDVKLRGLVTLDRQLKRARRADAHARGLETHRPQVGRRPGSQASGSVCAVRSANGAGRGEVLREGEYLVNNNFDRRAMQAQQGTLHTERKFPLTCLWR